MRKKSYTRPLGVVLDENLFDQLIEHTDRTEISKSEFIRSLIQDYFQAKDHLQEQTETQNKGGKHHE